MADEKTLYRTDVTFEGTPIYLGEADDDRAARFGEWVRQAVAAMQPVKLPPPTPKEIKALKRMFPRKAKREHA